MSLLERLVLSAIAVLFAAAALAYVILVLQRILDERGGGE